MRLFLMLTIALCTINAIAQSTTPEKEFPKSFRVTITNPLQASRENVMVRLSSEELKKIKDFNARAFVVERDGSEISSQYNAGDRETGIVFVLDHIAAKGTKEVVVRYHPSAVIARAYKKLTQAELSYKTGGAWKNREYIGGAFENTKYLRVPPEHKDHSWFIRYEGPGWESDKVGYRLYLDQRNATDVFGKKTSEPVLQNVGMDGFDSYHNMQPWGMDVMKVGKSLGVGSIGALVNGAAIRVEKTDSVNCTIADDGAVYSSVVINYFGWLAGTNKSDVQSTLSIHAGTRLTHEHLRLSGKPGNLVTGIVKDAKAKRTSSKGDAQRWGYVATYGNQSLNNDNLGLVVFFDPAQFAGFTEDEFSHIVSLAPKGNDVDYYFAGIWSGEPGGIINEEQFVAYVNAMAAELAHPVKVSILLK
jgi:hypothetical protein